MKKQSSLKLLALSLGLTVAGITQSTNAAEFSYEPFAINSPSPYNAGAQLDNDTPSPAITGYSGDWVHASTSFGTQDILVQAAGLDYTGAGYTFAETGGSVGVPNNTSGGEIVAGNSGRNARNLTSDISATASDDKTLYLSLLYQNGRETGATVYQMLALYDGIGNTDNDTFRNFDIGLTNNGGQTGNQYDFGVDNAYSNFGVAADTGVHLFVVKFTLSSTALSDSVQAWLDPTSEASSSVTVTGKDLIWNALALADYDGNSASWDEIRWGTTYVDVVPEPGTFAMLLGGMGMLTLFRRRKGIGQNR